jgi:hypothetical protein
MGARSEALARQFEAKVREASRCSRSSTTATGRRRPRQGAATAGAVVRGLDDEQLAASAVVFADAPPMTAEQMIVGALIAHVDEHLGSIRRTVGG